MKISLFEVSFFLTFFGAILGPIWLPFSGPKISNFFSKISKNRRLQKTTPPFIRHFLPSALRTPKMCPKGPQNAPKMLPKMSPRGLQMSLLQCLRAPSSLRYSWRKPCGCVATLQRTYSLEAAARCELPRLCSMPQCLRQFSMVIRAIEAPSRNEQRIGV